jgi:hypothetical protein
MTPEELKAAYLEEIKELEKTDPIAFMLAMDHWEKGNK